MPFVREASTGTVYLGPRLSGVRVGVDVGEACRGHIGWLGFRLKESVLHVASQVWAAISRAKDSCRVMAVSVSGYSGESCKSCRNDHMVVLLLSGWKSK
jgi:hypothetical protein